MSRASLRLLISLCHCRVQSKSGTIRSSEGPGNQLRVNPTNFFAELKRRNVYRAAVAYGVVAWFLTQLTTQVLPLFEIPNSAMRFVVIALAIGFPIAMLLAWVYEFTPEGVVRTEDLHPAQARSAQRVTGRILDFIIIGALLLVIAMLIVGRLPFYRQTGESISLKSIAVLPFENLSEEKQNAYFAEGIQNEILTRLATVRDLKVISRTSTAKYQSKPDNLKSVAQELGVSTVPEGAVQKAGDKVRVNVQLVDARADRHLWTKSYDRDLRDVLAVESEVSQEIVDALQANLSPSESHVLAAVRTHDTEAYDLFLRGEYEFHQATSTLVAGDAYDRADVFYRQALARDPNFAEAAAELARSRLSRHWNVSPLAPAELEQTKSLIDRAMALAPNSSEVHFALGLFFYWGHRQYEMALTEFNRTLELQPNNALARQHCASVYRRRGEWERSLA
jgi:TolB-like protein